jgi:uncharacterized protein (TIGR00296 family)
MDFTDNDYKLLPLYCFDILISVLKERTLEVTFPENFKDKEYPVFVTWTTGKEKDLRGCIGTFNQDNLEKNLIQYAYYSAFKDTRFAPISMKEVNNLNCGVSLLVNFEVAEHALDWEVGKHGITIDFSHNGNKFHATFLPEVAGDRNWDHKTTLKHLVHKAGFKGPLDDILSKVKLTRYQSVKIALSYSEYVELRAGTAFV